MNKFTFIFLIIFPATVFADATLGDYLRSSDERVPNEKVSEEKAKVEERKELVTDDKRMPPVLPGEEVETRGKRMKVWSTSGQVSGGEPPQPPTISEPSEIGDIDVIIDERDGRGHKSPGKKGRFDD